MVLSQYAFIDYIMIQRLINKFVSIHIFKKYKKTEEPVSLTSGRLVFAFEGLAKLSDRPSRLVG